MPLFPAFGSSFASAVSETRVPYWDNLKGLLIVLVVLGHFFFEYMELPAAEAAMYYVYSFHMPAFLLVSGYFSRKPRALGAKALAWLLAAFLLINFSLMFYGVLVEGDRCHLAHLYFSSWYLLALVLYRLTLPVCSRIPFILPISIAASLLIGMWGDLDDIFRLSKIIALYPFFLIGYRLPDGMKNRLLSRRNGDTWWAALAFAGVSALVVVLIRTGWIDFSKVVWVHYELKRELVERGLFFVLILAAIGSLMFLVPTRSLGLIARWGRNSLAIYLLHRPCAAALHHWAGLHSNPHVTFAGLLVASAVLLFVFGSDWVSRCVKRFLDWVTGARRPEVGCSLRRKSWWLAGTLLVPALMLCVLSSPYAYRCFRAWTSSPEVADPIYPTLSESDEALLKRAVKIGFVGDLILLRDQVMRAYSPRDNSYDFDPVFAYAAPYLSEPDATLGVLEGPLAGGEKPYTSSNFDDGLPLALNFPDEWLESIGKAGIDFVTLSNNHLLDQGEEGVKRTLDVLEKKRAQGNGVQFSGAYRSPADHEKNRVFHLRVKGLDVAILTYTYGSNTVPDSYLQEDPETSFVTSALAAPGSAAFEKCRDQVLADLKKAKESHADCIIVMPHMGEQFLHAPDDYQKTWCRIFAEGGGDIIFSDHPHAVQPIEWRRLSEQGREKNVLIVHCPGNFVNSYTLKDGDACAMVTAYLDPETGKPVASSVVPLWTRCPLHGNYQALPIYEAMHDTRLNRMLSVEDYRRMSEVHELITEVMIGHRLSIDQAQRQYYLFPHGYARNAVLPLELTDAMRQKALFKVLAESSSVCFIGDSLTEGTKNGGYGWFEPLMALFPKCKVDRKGWGAYTSKMVLSEKLQEIEKVRADTFVLALGTNDVRYRNPALCAMTAQEYVCAMDGIVASVRAKNPDAHIVLIGAWGTDEYDPVSAPMLTLRQREDLMAQYRAALKEYAERHGFLFVDPNAIIAAHLRGKWTGYYLKDHIHPNAGEGLRLYSRAVLEASAEDAQYTGAANDDATPHPGAPCHGDK